MKATIAEYNMLQQNEMIVVAVSGGPDSVAMLHLLHQLSQQYHLNLWVAHLDHRLRGKESEKDASFVQEISSNLGWPVIIERIDITKKKMVSCSLQETARQIRYDFLCQVAEKVGSSKLALAHQADDNIETILMWLLRGCGPQGMKGIPPVRQIKSNYQIIRPLIRINRLQIHNYLREHRLNFRIDASNLKRDYLRNKIRLDLLPLLAKYNPQIGARLTTLSHLWQLDDHGLMELAKQVKDEVNLRPGQINLTALRSKHPSIQSRLLRMAISEVKGDLKGISSNHILAILDLVNRPGPQRRLDLAGGIEVELGYEQLIIRPKGLLPQPKEGFEAAIIVPGETVINLWQTNGNEDKNSGERLVVNQSRASEEASISQLRVITSILPSSSVALSCLGKDTNIAYLDYHSLALPLRLRNRRSGDRFQPCGLVGSKKIKDFFIDLKLPLDQRDKIPLMVDQEKIVWVAGLRIDERVKVTNNTDKVLKIKIEGWGK